jgi:hypothetical protein
MKISEKGWGTDAECLYQAGIDAFKYEKLRVALILFKKASSMGHKEASRFVMILSKIHKNKNKEEFNNV